MLRANLCIQSGVNGCLCRVADIVYLLGQSPPALPHLVLFTFLQYTVSAFVSNLPRSVPIAPLMHVWNSINAAHSCRHSSCSCSSQCMSIHKHQGLTLGQAVVDLCTLKQSPGLSFVAVSWVWQLTDLILQPFTFDCISHLGVAPSALACKTEETQWCPV